MVAIMHGVVSRRWHRRTPTGGAADMGVLKPKQKPSKRVPTELKPLCGLELHHVKRLRRNEMVLIPL
jgi:hypothetical protein